MTTSRTAKSSAYSSTGPLSQSLSPSADDALLDYVERTQTALAATQKCWESALSQISRFAQNDVLLFQKLVDTDKIWAQFEAQPSGSTARRQAQTIDTNLRDIEEELECRGTKAEKLLETWKKLGKAQKELANCEAELGSHIPKKDAVVAAHRSVTTRVSDMRGNRRFANAVAGAASPQMRSPRSNIRRAGG